MILIFSLGCSSPETKKDSKNPLLPLQPIHLDKIIGIAQVAPENNIIQLSSQVGGTVVKILKKENDSVRKGEIILEMDHVLEDAKMKQISDQVGTQKNQIESDKASVEEYRAKFSNSETELKRLESLVSKGAETQQAVDDARTNLRSFQSNLIRLQNNVKVSQSRLAETLASLEVSRQEREQKIIRAPVTGKILEITPVIGTAIDNKSSFGQICPLGRTIAICEIDELNASKVKEGQRGWIRNLGSTDTLSTGTVYFAASFLKKKSLFTDQPGEKEDRRVREIKMVLDHPEKLILNARVESVIQLNPHSN